MSEVSEIVKCGIDVGNECIKIVLENGEIVRNEVGGHTIPTAVALPVDQQRQMGHTAPRKTAIMGINRFLLGDDLNGDDLFSAFERHYDRSSKQIVLDDGRTFSPAAVLAMLLGNVRANVEATVDRLAGKKKSTREVLQYVLCLPPDTSAHYRQSLLAAAYAAGMASTVLTESPQAYAILYQRKYLGQERKVLVVDMGHAQTTVAVLHNTADDCHVLASASQKALGAGVIDVKLWHHFQSSNPVLQQAVKNPQSKYGWRLLEGCRKLKHLLSQLPEGTVTAENIEDRDIQLTAKQSLLEDICQEPMEALTSLMASVTMEMDGSIDAIEVVGGGCRIPLIKQTIRNAYPNISTLSFSLDDTSVAFGAALVPPERWLETETVDPDFAGKLKIAEQEMAARDQELAAKAELFNTVESHILEMRAARNGKYGKLLPEGLEAHLTQIEDWLFSDEAAQMSGTAMKENFEATLEETKEMCREYYAEVEKEREATERAMEAEAAQAALERGQQNDTEDDDHDNRRLPKKRRMEIVMKNKAEANELFSDGNFQFAAARYAKALSHCAKFVDLSPDDIQEVNAVKVALNINLALAYLKLTKVDQALRVCNDALDIDGDSTKALYRRASVYFEKKNWEKANKDIKKASLLAPEDKAIKKLEERIETQVKLQQQKERKMAQKMFG